VWNEACGCFRPFAPEHFPPVIETKPRPRMGQFEGITATCVSRRRRS